MIIRTAAAISVLAVLASPAFAQTRPIGSVPLVVSATGTTGVTTATLPAAAGLTTYICSFSIDATATAGTIGIATITGMLGGTMSILEAVGASPLMGSMSRSFNPCVPGSAANTAIVVNSIAAGAGGSVTVNAWGFQN